VSEWAVLELDRARATLELSRLMRSKQVLNDRVLIELQYSICGQVRQRRGLAKQDLGGRGSVLFHHWICIDHPVSTVYSSLLLYHAPVAISACGCLLQL
jgi:hypothetical protein